MPYDVNAGKDLVKIDEILARYLWNQKKHLYLRSCLMINGYVMQMKKEMP